MRRLDSPTIDLLVVFGVVFVLQQVGGVVGLDLTWIALAVPLSHPWTLATSVYAHASLGHLLANAVALALVGFPLERSTTRARFHGFVLATGAAAGSAELLAGALLNQPSAVLGASGAVLALYGYVLAGNPLAGLVFDRLSRRATAALVAGVAVLVTLLTGGPGVAVVAHATGFALGVVAGRSHLLRVHRSPGASATA